MHGRRCSTVVAVVLVAVALGGGVGPATASAFDPAQVVQLLKREIAAADSAAEAGAPSLRVEEAVLDLNLVEIAGKGGSRLLVPGADFGVGKDEAAKPALRRRLLVDLATARQAKAETSAEPPPEPASGPAGPLTRVLADLRSGLRPAVEAPPGWELKRLGVDLEFVLERDSKGAPALVVIAAGRPIGARNVQKLKLRLAAREK